MAPDQTAQVPADWYPDPYGVSQLRWWDGQNWTDSIHPPAAPPPSDPTPAPVAPQEPVTSEPVTQEPVAPPESVTPEQVTPEAPPAVAPEPTPAATPVEPETDPFDALGLSVPESTSAPENPTPNAEEPTQAASAPVQPTTPPLVTPPLESPEDGQAPAEPTPAGQDPAESSAPPRLPSRREMRIRNELNAEKTSSASTSADHTVFPDSTPNNAPQAAQTPAPGFAPPTQQQPPPVGSVPETPPGAVPDSSTATAFDWLTGADAGGGVNPPPASTTPQTGQSGFPPMSAQSASTSAGATGQSGPSEAPSAVVDAWARTTDPGAIHEEVVRSTATQKSTISGWIIALMPLIAGVLSIAAVKGQENYPRYVPENLEWWMLVGVVIGVLYLATILLAVADRNKLDWAGYYRPAHWAWSLLTAPVYLLLRTISVSRETGRNSILLWVWLALAVALIGAWFAADQFAPELIEGYVLPFV